MRFPVFLLALVVALGGCERPSFEPIGELRARSGARGVRWLLEHAEEIPPGMRLLYFVRLSRIVLEGPLAEPVRRERDRALGIALTDPDRTLSRLDDPGQPAKGRNAVLTALLVELWRRHLLGDSIARERDEAGRWLERNEPSFWEGMPLAQQFVFVQRFQRIGLTPERTWDDVLGSLRRRLADVGEHAFLEDSSAVSGLVQAFLSASDDFSRHVDASRLEPELELLRRAERLYLDFDPPAGFSRMLEARSQLVTCLELARQPLSELEHETLRWVAAQQQPDGSFADPGEPIRARAHATFVAARGMWPLERPFGPEQSELDAEGGDRVAHGQSRR